VQFRPHPEVYLEEGLRMLQLADDIGDAAVPDLIHLTDIALLRALSEASIGRAHFYLGDADEARDWLERALGSAGGSYGPLRIHILGSLALAEAWQGRLLRAAELVDEALDLSRELALLAHPAPADAHLARALIAIQRGEPETAAFALHEGYLRALSNGRVQLLWIAHAESRLVDPEGTDASAMPPTGTPPPIVRIALRAVTHRQMRQVGGSAPVSAEAAWSDLLFEDVAGLLSSRDSGSARARLRAVPLPQPASPAQAVEHGVLLAWLSDLEGRQAESRRFLTAALELAEVEGLVQPFLRAGSHVEELLRAMPAQPVGFRRTVLERFAPAHPAAGQLTEPLTARELELLAYLPSRLTNAELASRCFVSVNTVKTHMAHIYRKLDAGGRDAAIARARELGLLESGDIARVG
jgi:LuxR family maltose regulon positive regulatory protein